MRPLLFVIAAIALLGCDAPKQTAAAEKQQPPVGRWTVVPSNSPAISLDAISHLYTVWRLDTQTGGLEICAAVVRETTSKLDPTNTLVRCTSAENPMPP
jgi:hypothetical protein